MKIAIVDILGLPYDGNTVYQRGLGGSESAVTYMAEELAKIGFEVTVFNECSADECQPGTYNRVRYQPLQDIANHVCDFDIAISSRTVEPWVPDHMREGLICKIDPNIFNNLRMNAKYKVLWLHDTFCYGDQLLERLVVENHIHKLFVLSDWHMSYVLNCDHGNRRNFEVLKNKTWITRNGVKNWLDWVDISEKNPHQFVYNSSVSKGMAPLLQRIWPQIQQQIPEATLKIVGGYYKFRSDVPPDEQEQTWHQLRDQFDNQLGVEFTGIIPQKQIAELLAQSTFMLYPGAFPETFGISAMESLNYHTPLITTRFGALEENALEMACYKIEYAIEPNGLFPNINTDQQIQQFVDLAVWAHSNRYLLQQKQQYCGVVRNLVGWNHVALQWKKHFHTVLDMPFSVEEFARVSVNQQQLGDIFGRRTVNPEDRQIYTKPEQPIYVLSPFYNCREYISRCIVSVATQNYENYTHILIDDASTDDSYLIAEQTINSCPAHIRSRFVLLRNKENQGAVFNHHQGLETCKLMGANKNAIIMLLDGDDWLVNRNDIFTKFNLHFDKNTEFSYGSCWSLTDNIPLVAQDYPPSIRSLRAYRSYKFNWIVPYTHMRAFRFNLYNKVDTSLWKDVDGNWFRAGGDTPVFYSLLECAHPDKIKVMKEIVVNYNDLNPMNDYKINSTQQLATAHLALEQKSALTGDTQLSDSQLPPDPIKQDNQVPMPRLAIMPQLPPILQPLPKPVYQRANRILIGIPTARYIEVDTFKSIYDLECPPNTELDFQYFYGYNVEQVRNLMVNWSLINGFSWMLSVDSDIIMPKHSLQRLLDIQDNTRAISSGTYIQRKEHQRIPEIYIHNPETGGHQHLPIEEAEKDQVLDVEAVGFGCCLVRRDVFENVGDPWFTYHSSLEFNKVLSEDVDFCMKAKRHGYQVVVDTGLKLGHISKTVLQVNNS